MCGIAGIFEAGLRPDALHAALVRMERSLVHRGPDEGAVRTFVEPSGGLSVRRLSIVDLEHGSQPCHNEDSTVFVLLNGEIYNYRELRGNLLAHGHQFRSESDTETIVHLYEEYGVDCLSRLQGMFALAIYDTRLRQLVLARDGPGMKPLYFARIGQGFVFGSDARTLFASGLIGPEADPAAIDTYLSIGFVPAPLSAFRGLERVRPGEYIVANGGGVRRGQFWEFRWARSEPGITDAEYANELDHLLTAAVRSHVAADVPVGALLSGGWDSSLTATLAAKLTGRKLKTFSVIFPEDPSADESRFSRLMAKYLGTDHHEIEFRTDLMPDLLPKICRSMEEPCGQIPAGVLFTLASLVRTHVKTVLSGEGADELFAGYPQFQMTFPYALRPLVPRPIARRAASGIRHVRLRRGLRFLGAIDGRTADAEWARLFTPDDKRDLLSSAFPTAGPDLQPVLIDPEVLASCRDTLQRRLAFEFTGRLANAVLLVSDKMSMAHSLEVRMPFLDPALVEFALRLPSRLKVRGGREKVILSALAERYLPPEIARRRKKGLAYPAGFWLRPPCDRYARDLLLGSSSGPFDRSRLERVLPGWLKKPSAGRQINYLVTLQAWWNEFIGRPAAQEAW